MPIRDVSNQFLFQQRKDLVHISRDHAHISRDHAHISKVHAHISRVQVHISNICKMKELESYEYSPSIDACFSRTQRAVQKDSRKIRFKGENHRGYPRLFRSVKFIAIALEMLMPSSLN